MHNGVVLIECKSIRHVDTPAAEAEMKGIFQNAKAAVVLRHLLFEMGYQ